MQLLLVLALILLRRTDLNGVLEEVKPLIEESSGEEVRKLIEEVDRISGVVSALTSAVGAPSAAEELAAADGGSKQIFPLKPISDIADDGIYNALARAL